ncbi:DoxX family membrane protein [Haloechinothrix sp. YIM 98757]|uniref:DoxX family membrane protein n=1 Tax=Haloechinothrix aidingensis TaxID=2752311 RepID=A0A838AB55_9PSEU|nr:DoxX family membrane protein [Haloechinothrix aidingensis]
MELYVEVLRVALAVSFFWSGSAKLGSPGAARRAMDEVPFVRKGTRLATYSLATFEVAAAVLIASPLVPALGYIATLLLATGIVVVSTWVIVTRRNISCGCFGSRQSKPLGWKNLFFGLGIVFASLFLLFGHGWGWSSSGTGDELARLVVMATAALVGTMARHADLISRPWQNFNLRGV